MPTLSKFDSTRSPLPLPDGRLSVKEAELSGSDLGSRVGCRRCRFQDQTNQRGPIARHRGGHSGCHNDVAVLTFGGWCDAKGGRRLRWRLLSVDGIVIHVFNLGGCGWLGVDWRSNGGDDLILGSI